MDAQRESGRDAAAVLQPPMAEDLQLSEPRLPHDILASALALFTWVATGSLVQAIATGLGDHPVRRLVIGVFLVAGSAWMYLAPRCGDDAVASASVAGPGTRDNGVGRWRPSMESSAARTSRSA